MQSLNGIAKLQCPEVDAATATAAPLFISLHPVGADFHSDIHDQSLGLQQHFTVSWDKG